MQAGDTDTWVACLNDANSEAINASDFMGTDEYLYYQDTDIDDG